MDPDTDTTDERPDVPGEPEPTLGGGDDAFGGADLGDMDLGPPVAGDDIGKSSSLWLWFALLALLGIVAGVGWLLYTSYEAEQTMWNDYYAAQDAAEDQDDFLRRMRELLPQTQHNEVRVRILEKFAEYRDAEAVPMIIDQLAGRPEVRTAAARALAAIGSPDADAAKPVLLESLEGAGTAERAAMVWALAVLGESAAADAIIEEFSSGRLQGQPNFDAVVISNVLGPERLSSDELLNHDETSVRTLTAAALAETATRDVVGPLSRMADFELARNEPDEHVLRSIASGLGRSGSESAARPLFNIMEQRPRQRRGVLESLRHSVGAPGIANLLEGSDDNSIILELVRMLATGHDPRSADALAGAAAIDPESCNGEEECVEEVGQIRREAAFGLAELSDPRAAPVLIELSRGLDLATAREALAKIQRLGVPEAADGLLDMLENDEEGHFVSRRANLLRALGTTGATHAGSVIEDLFQHYIGDNDDIAADPGSAAAALADLRYEPAYAGMLRLAPRPRDVDFSQPLVSNEIPFNNRTAAVRAIGRYGLQNEDAFEVLETIIEDPLDDRRLRQDAGMALGAIATPEILSMVIQKLQDPELDPVAKRYYLAALWQNPSNEVAEELMQLIENTQTEPDVRRSAALAVGYAADPDLDSRVGEMLGNAELKREAAFIILLGGSSENANALLAMLENDDELRQVLLFALRDDQSNAFNLVTRRAFESGQIWRRLQVAYILNVGIEDNRHAFPWNHIITRLGAGWDGHDGMTPRAIREELWNELRGNSAERRVLVARVLGQMAERGLLMAARDQTGAGSEEARDQLRRMNNPEQEN